MERRELLLGTTTATSGEDAYEAIRRAILEGRLKPGERIVEQRLAQTLDVSRTPVREALLKLERENLVARTGRGMAVRSFSSDEVRDIYDLRAHVESYGARIAAQRITEPELARLALVQDELEREQDANPAEELEWLRALARLNQQFHFVVVRSARNGPLERIVTQVVQTPLVYKAYLWYGDDAKRSSSVDHRRLVELLGARDAPAAEEHWRRHIEFGRDVLVERLTEQEADGDTAR